MTTKIYQDVLINDLSPADAKKKLLAEQTVESEEIFITPALVKAFLAKYLADEIDTKRLSEWSAFLISQDVYVTPGWEDDNRADRFEPMWKILQQLSTPFIDGPINKEKVKSLIEELSELESK